MIQQQSTGRGFEEEVRRIARLLWPTPAYQGAEIIDGRERDTVIVTDDAIHIVEATTLRTKAKAQEDIEKTSKLVSRLRKDNPDKIVKGWFVTRDDLTADQHAIANQYKRTVSAVPFKEFLSRIVDARSYLGFREKRSFGSVADPISNQFSLPRESYVAPSFYEDRRAKGFDFDDFYKASTSIGARTVVLGDFGAGKSMALRELFFRAASDFYSGTSNRFPIYLNLRAHIGQASPVEALIREAMNTGYGKYDDLVKAWRADLVVLILDGFDELITPAWTQKASQLKEHRAACAKLVAEFVRESPADTPILMSGRFSYFGSTTEMERSLKLYNSYNLFRINDFTKSQTETLLKKLNLGGILPDWLPTRPLLLGYIAAYARRQGVDVNVGEVNPAEGWDYLIDRICEREADIHSGLYAEYVRRLLERIATKARYSIDITAPVTQIDISSAFREIFGRDADESNLGMLMRLPGLVAAENQNDDRRFVDSDFANVFAAGDLFEYISSHASFDTEPFASCRVNIDALGADFIISKISRSGRPTNTLSSCLEALSSSHQLSTLKGDILSILAASDASERDRWITLDDAFIENLDVRQAPPVFKKIRLSQSTIVTLEVDEANTDGIPHLQGCLIGTLRGPTSPKGLESWINDTSIEQFEYEPLTNNSILGLDLATPVKIGLTALRKLYLQRGSGRQENAFYRGIDQDFRKIVDRVLNALVSGGYASISGRPGDRIYLRNPERTAEVLEFLSRKASPPGPLKNVLEGL